jgi:hypothetical protein
MAAYADALIAVFAEGVESRGTRNMVAEAQAKGLPVYLHSEPAVSVGTSR